ncbi:hypothetical protein [Pseudoflavonifractor phocaeensis]|uniref:hypothetical protein n=1 Tax=Pseudoflavonifractor phocaeensis TaxID=1870988 RepID=UPI0019577183|nr:hypothetical protein [Pseudoflavonifractor phocaeensis]MBM6927590.1 hypothetical protein [Pseudoflavonifractor phocaeensis]
MKPLKITMDQGKCHVLESCGLQQDGNHAIYGDYVFTVEPNVFALDRLTVWISKRGYFRAFYCFGMARSALESELMYQLGDKNRLESYIRMFDSLTENSPSKPLALAMG